MLDINMITRMERFAHALASQCYHARVYNGDPSVRNRDLLDKALQEHEDAYANLTDEDAGYMIAMVPMVPTITEDDHTEETEGVICLEAARQRLRK